MLYSFGKGSELIEKPQENQKYYNYCARSGVACHLLVDLNCRRNTSNLWRILPSFLFRCKARHLNGLHLSFNGCVGNSRFFGLRRRNRLAFGTDGRFSSRLSCRRSVAYPCRNTSSQNIIAPYCQNTLDNNQRFMLLSLRCVHNLFLLFAKRLKHFVLRCFYRFHL